MRRTIIIISFLYLSLLAATSQSVEVNCTTMPLNKLLVKWREQYAFQFSYNDAELAKYQVSLKSNFSSLDNALTAILEDLPLDFEKNGEVYIIYPVKPILQTRNFKLIGRAVEAQTLEPLPFSHIMANGIQAVTDLKGMFSFHFEDDSVFEVKASHLGCYVLDTILVADRFHNLILTPSSVDIKEIRVTNNIVEQSTQIGESPGLISLNHHIAQYLPGNGDNSVFNLLRLQPGVLAAGEQPNDLIIWGSPEGTSRVKFDGFTIWGLKNFNDNISAVNPYLAKNIEVQKGGYNASNEDVIGGIVKINGKTGSTVKPGFNLFLNNQTLNGMVELPVFKKSSIILAFRQTYYNLFDSDDLNYVASLQRNGVRLKATPYYQFRDYNFKYSLQEDNGNMFYISLLHGNDNFKMDISTEKQWPRWEEYRNENNQQSGGTLFYGKTWSSGHTGNLKISYSELHSHYTLLREVTRRNNSKQLKKSKVADNEVKELSAQWENTFILGEQNVLCTGVDFVHNEVRITEDSMSFRYIDLFERANRISVYVQDKIRMGKHVNLTTGLRYNYSNFTNKMYVDPRISLSIQAGGQVKLNASWGLYHQFLVKSSVEDQDGNYRYSWSLADEDEVPVLNSNHWVVGAAYTRHNFLFSVDAFHKHNEGLTRFLLRQQSIYTGQSRSYGIDFFAKKDFHGHALWASYSLAKTEERYDFFPDTRYRRAPQDQRHELKMAGLLNMAGFHFSASYVYGSGFPLYSDYLRQVYTEPDYNRLDVSLIYKLAFKSYSGEAGVSVLNVTGADNIKYTQFERVPIEQLNTVFINANAVSFTPLLYLKLKF